MIRNLQVGLRVWSGGEIFSEKIDRRGLAKAKVKGLNCLCNQSILY